MMLNAVEPGLKFMSPARIDGTVDDETRLLMNVADCCRPAGLSWARWVANKLNSAVAGFESSDKPSWATTRGFGVVGVRQREVLAADDADSLAKEHAVAVGAAVEVAGLGEVALHAG